MNLAAGPDMITEEEFMAEARAFLESHAAEREVRSFEWGVGSDRVGLFRELAPAEDAAEVLAAREWRRTIFDAGLGWISGPLEYGGRGLPTAFDRRYAALEARFETPSQAALGIGLNMVGPTILAHGQEAVKRRYAAGLRRGDVVGCQLFSEPDAGSDLASVRTHAYRDGDEWVVTGEKLWTSHARHAHIGELLCRTDVARPKHEGLSMFIVAMDAPGVEVRPLRQMTGGASFNAVRLDGVRIPDALRLGEVNGGWKVTQTTLANERAAIGGASRRDSLSTTRLLELIRHHGDPEDPLIRQAMASAYISAKVAGYTSRRIMERVRTGSTPGSESSIVKLARAQNLRHLSAMLGSILGPKLVADNGEWGTYAWSELVLGVPAVSVAGGTDQILKNVLAERVLGLPRDPAPASPR